MHTRPDWQDRTVPSGELIGSSLHLGRPDSSTGPAEQHGAGWRRQPCTREELGRLEAMRWERGQPAKASSGAGERERRDGPPRDEHKSISKKSL